MSMNSLNALLGHGGAGLTDLPAAVKELQGLNISVLTGASANTKIDVAALREEDTIIAALVQGAVTVAGVAEVQEIAVAATGGTFTITWNGQTTSALAYNASAATVQTALEALNNVAPGDVVVTGGPGDATGSTPYILTWSPTLGNVAQPTCTGTSLTKTSEVQHVTVDATSGTFTVTYSGQTTSALAFDVSAADFTTALVALSNIAPGDVVVTGGPGNSGGTTPYVLTWNSQLGNVAEVTATDVNLAGGGDTVTPSTITTGVAPTVTPSTTAAGVQQSGGLFVNDTANITIQSTKASGTLTFASAIADNTFAVNGVTYTVKAVPTAPTHLLLGGTDTQMAAKAAALINAYENRYTGSLTNEPQVVATSAGAVVTITSVADGAGNGPVVTDTGSTITISNTDPAAVTATFVSAGNNDALTVNGVVFTIKTIPTDTFLHMGVKASDTLQAAEAVRAINHYENIYGSLDVVASNAAGVVTLRPRTAKKGNIIVLTGTVTTLAASGSGLLASGTVTGGIKSTTDLTGESMLLFWFNKR